MLETSPLTTGEPVGSLRRPATPDVVDPGVARYAGLGTDSFELPWRVVSHGDALELFVVRLREESVSDPANTSIVMGCGGALENMRLAVAHAGFVDDVTFFPDGSDETLVATLRAGEPRVPAREEAALFGAVAHPDVPQRETQEGAKLAPAQVALLHHAARTRGCWIDVIADDCRRAMIADLVVQATTLTDAARGSRPLFSILGSDESPLPSLSVPDKLGLEELFGSLGAWVRRTPAFLRRTRIWRGTEIIEAPLVLVLGSAGDSPKDWLYAGAALQRVLLHATVQHLVATLYVGPMQHPLVRDQLRTLLFSGGQPHAIIRFDAAATGM